MIIPTSGRPTLRRTLRSIRRQDRGDVEVIVVSDGDQPVAESIVRLLDWSAVTYVHGLKTESWGQMQRERGIVQARGEYLLFMDDDDVYRRRAFQYIRRAVEENPGRVILFRMRRYDGVLWQRAVIEEGATRDTPVRHS